MSVRTPIKVLSCLVIALLIRSTSLSADELKIGLIAPLSGPWQAIGQRIVKGAELAALEYNANNPLKIKILAQDDQFDGKLALAAYQKMTQFDGINALITADSISIDVLHPHLIKTGLPTIQLAEMGTEPVADNVFQITEEFMACGDALALALNKVNPQKVVAVSANIRAYERFYERFANNAKFPIEHITINSDASVSSIVPKIIALKPTHLVLMMGPLQSGEIVKLYRIQQRNQTPIYLEEDMLVDLDAFKSQVPDLTVVHNDMVSLINRTTDPQFVASYRKKFSEAPEYAEYGYDAVMVLAKTYNPDPKKWVSNIEKTDLIGATGKVAFDSRGVRVGDTKVVSVKEALEMRAK